MLQKNNVLLYSMFFTLCSLPGALLSQDTCKSESQDDDNLSELFEKFDEELVRDGRRIWFASPQDVQRFDTEEDNIYVTLEKTYKENYSYLLTNGPTPHFVEQNKKMIEQINLTPCSYLRVYEYAINHRSKLNQLVILKEQKSRSLCSTAMNLDRLKDLWSQYDTSHISRKDHQTKTDDLCKRIKRALSDLPKEEQVEFYLYLDANYGALDAPENPPTAK
jgi:hypothetical protein